MFTDSIKTQVLGLTKKQIINIVHIFIVFPALYIALFGFEMSFIPESVINGTLYASRALIIVGIASHVYSLVDSFKTVEIPIGPVNAPIATITEIKK